MKKLLMAVIALMMTISASAQFYIYFSDGTVAKVDSISIVAPEETDSTNNPTMPDEPTNPSAGIGIFSVGEGKTVTFSKGNLQYTRSTNTWAFAENQWEYIGTDNVTGGSVTSDEYGDYKNGTALADKIDLFGWSTNATNFGVSTLISNSDYSGSFVDWGINQIGNDAPNTWRTLTYDEWNYLLNTRPNANSLKGVAQVNGVNGLILLPDSWTCPAGVIFKSGFHSVYGVDYYAAYQTFIAAEWSKLEAAGAVFLPAPGYRTGSNVKNVQSSGNSWTATENTKYDARCLVFFSDGAHLYLDNLYNAHGVRLVKDIEGGGATPDTPDTPDTPTEPEEPENTENGHEYVDLGLSVKWATCNVGATKLEEYGDYFAWGETQPKSTYDWSTYKWCRGSIYTQTKYCTNSSFGTVDNKTTLELSDDAARANWGGSWRMPTKAEQDELRTECTWTWTTENGVNGYRVTSNKAGYTDKSIFLPAAGCRYPSAPYYAGSCGYYWSSSLYTDYPSDAYLLSFSSGEADWRSHVYRDYGFSVRPVCQ